MKTKKFKIAATITFFMLCFQSLFAIEALTDIDIMGKPFIIQVNLENKMYTVNMFENGVQKGETLQVIQLSSTNLHDFLIKFIENHEGLDTNNLDRSNFRAKSDLKFIELMAAIFNTDEMGPEIAQINLESLSNVYHKIGNNETKLDSSFKAQKCQIIFENGFIKSILIQGTYEKQTLYFSNGYPIGITTRANIKNLTKVRLYDESGKNDKTYVILGELINYDRILNVRTNDYSPSNQKITLTAGGKRTSLTKGRNAELFQLNIFSDFVGLNSDNPNGLIQTEINKRINLLTSRTGVPFINSGVGVFTHLIPFFQLSKIEDHNRDMSLSRKLVGDTALMYYTNPLEIYRYSNFQVGAELNIFDLQGAAFELHINGLAFMTRTNVKDSIFEDNKPIIINEKINSLNYGLSLKLLFNPEPRWSLQLSSTSFAMQNLNYNIDYYSPTKNGLEKSALWLHAPEFKITLNTSGDNKIFARYRFVHEWNNWDNNFSELQLGYSISLKTSTK